MKNRINQNPQNGGNKQPMQNQAQTNGQAYLAQPYGTSPQNYNQPTGQQSFDVNCSDEQHGNDCQQYNNCQTAWYSDNFSQRGYQSHGNFSNGSDFQGSNINPEDVAPDAFDSLETQQPYPPRVTPPDGNDPATQPYPPVTSYYETYMPPYQKSGQLFNLLRATQPRDYSGVNCDGCTPTDIDGGLDVKGQGFIHVEMKCLPHREKWLVQTGRLYPPNRIPTPQKIYLERLTNATQRAGFPSALFLADHDAFSPNQVINAAEAIVLAIYYHGYWFVSKNKYTLKESVRFFWDAVLNGEGDNLDWYYANNF